MPKKILELRNKDKTKLSYFCISDDWFSYQPWEYKGKPIKFIDYTIEYREYIKLETYYFGPFALLKGKLYE